MATEADRTGRHRVVIVGGGFGGLNAALGLRDADVDVTLVDERNFHLFQPLTYQVATGALSPGEVAYPLRTIFKRARNVRVLLARVADIDLAERALRLQPVSDIPAPHELAYDTLVVATGSRYSYFGHDEWSAFAPEVKSLESALAVRARILAAFEAAEIERDPDARRSWLTFVVVGAGPTGVEMAGQIAEIARDALPGEFRSIDPREARILLVEAGDRVLASFPPGLSRAAERSLAQLGVTTMTGAPVVEIADGSVTVRRTGAEDETIAAHTTIWAAGVRASDLATTLARGAGEEPDRAGRVLVEPDLTLPGHPEVLALGDMASVRDVYGQPLRLPGVAPVAIQQGRYAAQLIADRLSGSASRPFRYRDKGNLATIGRARAVADIRGMHVSGFPAWAIWLLVHLWYLIGVQNRLLVLLRWTISFVTHGRGARLITAVDAEAGALSSRPPR